VTAATAEALTGTALRPLPVPPADGVDQEVLPGSMYAEIDGFEGPVEQGPAGLLAVEIPEDVLDGTPTPAWSPPGGTVSFAAAGLGLALTALQDLTELRRRRTAGTIADGTPGAPANPGHSTAGKDTAPAGTQEN
jgi:hypothetical protein